MEIGTQLTGCSLGNYKNEIPFENILLVNKKSFKFSLK
jgi:hypothetical protein